MFRTALFSLAAIAAFSPATSNSIPCTIGAICLPSTICASAGGTFIPAIGCGPNLGCCADYTKTGCGDGTNGFGICQESEPNPPSGSSCINGGKFIGDFGCPGPETVKCCVTPCNVANTDGFCQTTSVCSGRSGVSAPSAICASTGLQCCLPSNPQVSVATRVSPSEVPFVPSGLKLTALANPDTLESAEDYPILILGRVGCWPFSYIDNRVALNIVCFQGATLISEFVAVGARYIVDITQGVASGDDTYTFIGQASRTVTATATDLLP